MESHKNLGENISGILISLRGIRTNTAGQVENAVPVAAEESNRQLLFQNSTLKKKKQETGCSGLTCVAKPELCG